MSERMERFQAWLNHERTVWSFGYHWETQFVACSQDELLPDVLARVKDRHAAIFVLMDDDSVAEVTFYRGAGEFAEADKRFDDLTIARILWMKDWRTWFDLPGWGALSGRTNTYQLPKEAL